MYNSSNQPLINLAWHHPHTGQRRMMSAALPVTIGRAADNSIPLDSKFVSAHHVRLEERQGEVFVIDMGSRNSVRLNNNDVSDESVVFHGDQLQIGPFTFSLEIPENSSVLAGPATQLLPTSQIQRVAKMTAHAAVTPVLPHQQPLIRDTGTADFPPAIFRKKIVPVDMLTRIVGEQIEETSYLAIGGGLGSFVWVDHLMVYGVKRQDIVSIGFEPKPYGRYRRLCRNSQIPDHERLRSNSDSCPDNLWGWPGYAVREIWDNTSHGRLGQAARIGWQIFNEPLVQTYTPKAGVVFDSIDQEAARIGWDKIWRHGRVRAVRKTDDGRYVVAYSLIKPDGSTEHKLILAQFVHLAVGYPGVRFLSDLQEYREKTGDFHHVVNAYEKHDEVYDHLEQYGGTVLIRGRGIVASRIIQRIQEARERSGRDIRIIHLMRSPNTEGQKAGLAQRAVDNHWEFQPFNWPKAAWGGDLRKKLENANTKTRAELLDQWGGTTTADRLDWRDMVREGLTAGWYSIYFGTVLDVRPHKKTGQIATKVMQNHGEVALAVADYIVDATGLEAGIEGNALLKDLVTHYDLPRNGKGRLKVTNDFALIDMDNGRGQIYASGISTLGGPFAAVDSFLGLQYAALRSVDNLTAQNAPGLRRLNGLRSLNQWTRWARGVQP